MRILSDVGWAVAGVVSPPHRRWRQLLASLALDPDLLPRPLTPPGERDFMICGSPRSGTTLLAAMLFQPPRILTVMEPWDGLRKPPAQLFADIRREVEETGRLSSGRLDIDAVHHEGAVRWVREQDTSYPVAVEPGWYLGVKWPAFWRYLELLPETRFLVCVRHPYEVIGSYRKKGGALAEGLDYDAAFNRRMNAELLTATKDPLVRQVLLFDSITARILPHLDRPNVYVVRYERWFTEPGQMLAEVAAFLDVELGPPPAKIRSEPPPDGLRPEDRARVRTYCTTAAALDYDLDRTSPQGTTGPGPRSSSPNGARGSCRGEAREATGATPGLKGRIHVLFVHNGLGTGGAERSLAELLAALPAHGIRATVAALFRRTEGVEREIEERGVDVRVLPAGHLARVRALRRLIAEVDPDLVHTTIFDADLAGRLAAVGGPRVLSSLVNASYDPVRIAADPNVGRLKLRLARTADGWTARHLTDHFHAISHSVAAAAVEALGIDPNRVSVIERGRDPARLGRPSPERRARVRRTLGLDDADEVVVNVGRQEYQKGQRYLLEAAAALVGRRPRLRVLVAGRRGNASRDLERRCHHLELDGRVRFLGHRDDVADVLAAADLFAFPSLFEGLGGALIEAMALGLPIVASDLAVFHEVVEPGGNAVLVPARRPDALASAMEALLDDSGRRASYGARSREIFAERFTADRATARMVGLYERLVGARERERA